jgi:hypothetical protein
MSEHQRAMLRGVLAQPADDDDALTFTASSTKVNRYGFALRHEGWRIDNYNANPVVLWMHMSHMPPIGRGRSTLRNGIVQTAVTFDRADPFAAAIEQKYRGGFLNAVSVGFEFVDRKGAPLADWWRLSAEEIRDEAFYDLAEVSAVPVPADPNALRQHRAHLAAGLMDDLWHDADRDELAALVELAAPLEPPPAGGDVTPPTLPGNGLLDRRIANLEAELAARGEQVTALQRQFLARFPESDAPDPGGGGDPSPDAPPVYTEDALQSLLAAATITLS